MPYIFKVQPRRKRWLLKTDERIFKQITVVFHFNVSALNGNNAFALQTKYIIFLEPVFADIEWQKNRLIKITEYRDLFSGDNAHLEIQLFVAQE